MEMVKNVLSVIARELRELGQKTFTRQNGVRVLKALRVVLILAAIVLIGWFVYWMFFVGTQQHRPVALPPVVATPTSAIKPNPLAQWEYLTVDEVRALRETPNVVILAVIDGGNVLYAKDRAVSLKRGTWKQTPNPFGFEALTTSGTKVHLKFRGQSYTINMLQGFVVEAETQKPRIYIVDDKGAVWELQNNEPIIPVKDAQSSMQIETTKNGELSLTIRERPTFK